jgi:hypothetical protein
MGASSYDEVYQLYAVFPMNMGASSHDEVYNGGDQDIQKAQESVNQIPLFHHHTHTKIDLVNTQRKEQSQEKERKERTQKWPTNFPQCAMSNRESISYEIFSQCAMFFSWGLALLNATHISDREVSHGSTTKRVITNKLFRRKNSQHNKTIYQTHIYPISLSLTHTLSLPHLHNRHREPIPDTYILYLPFSLTHTHTLSLIYIIDTEPIYQTHTYSFSLYLSHTHTLSLSLN